MTLFKKANFSEEISNNMESELSKLAEEEATYLKDVPPGFIHKYFYDTHWVFEYDSPPAPKKYYLKLFKGDAYWSDIPNLVKKSEAKNKELPKPKNPGKNEDEKNVWRNYGYDANDINDYNNALSYPGELEYVPEDEEEKPNLLEMLEDKTPEELNELRRELREALKYEDDDEHRFELKHNLKLIEKMLGKDYGFVEDSDLDDDEAWED